LKDDKAHMMVIEVVIFAAMVFLALIFLYQLSPSSTLSDQYTNELKTWGDDALYSIAQSLPPEPFKSYPDYPDSKLVHYLIANDYSGLTTDLNDIFPPTVLYNIWISNGTNSIFWCNSFSDNSTILPLVDPVTICHYYVSIDPNHLRFLEESNIFVFGTQSELSVKFKDYDDSSYDLLLELWYK